MLLKYSAVEFNLLIGFPKVLTPWGDILFVKSKDKLIVYE